MKAFYNSQPAKFETVGDGSFYYRWNIQQYGLSGSEELTGGNIACLWQCDEVLVWAPMTVDKVIDAVIHSKYSIAEELAIANDYVGYQNSSVAASDAIARYVEYISFVANSRTMVMNDFKENDEFSEPITMTRLLNDVVKFANLTVNNSQITDKDALSIKSVYPQWESYIGKTLTVGTRVQHDKKLWKVLQDHTAQQQYQPGVGTESLYTEVVENTDSVEVGTLNNPIPYNNNMELECGKYYSQGGVKYKCTRNTGQPVYNPLSELVGIYVEVAQ